jgi:hypothetical protein
LAGPHRDWKLDDTNVLPASSRRTVVARVSKMPRDERAMETVSEFE